MKTPFVPPVYWDTIIDGSPKNSVTAVPVPAKSAELCQIGFSKKNRAVALVECAGAAIKP